MLMVHRRKFLRGAAALAAYTALPPFVRSARAAPGDIKLINATELNLDYQLTCIPFGGRDYPIRVGGTWTTHACPYSSGVGIVTDIRNPWTKLGGTLQQVGNGTDPYFSDGTAIYAYLKNNGASDVIAWSATGHSVDPNSGYECMAGDPDYLLIGGASLIGGKFKYNVSIQNMCSWQNPKMYAWKAPYAAGLPNFGTNWQELDPGGRVGAFFWANQGGLMHFKGGFQASANNTSIYAALKINPPAYTQGQNIGASTEYDAILAPVAGQAVVLGMEVGVLGQGDGMILTTPVAYATAMTPRANAGINGIVGFY